MGEQRRNDTRFSLANERTFLAWGRTCMAMVATGLAVGHFLAEDTDSVLPVASGIGLIVLGAVLALWSYAIYRRNGDAIERGEPIRRSVLPAVLLATIGVVAIVAVALTLSSSP